MDDTNNNQTMPEDAMPQDERSECERMRDEYLAGWQRTKADFINYKKDEVRRLEEFGRYQLEGIFKEMITVLDNFDLCIRALEKKGDVEKGIYMIRTQLEDMMKRKGLTRITIRAGDPFDPNVAEAIAEAESDFPEGAVVEEIEAGYRLHDKVIRPARVKVSKGKHQ